MPLRQAAADWLPPLLVSGYVATVVHELGHAVAGRLAGLRVAAVGIGMSRTVGVRLFGCRLFAGFDDTGGLCVFLPGRWADPRWRAVVGTAGGPAASLAVAVGCALLWSGTRQVWAGVFAGANLLVTGLTLYPKLWATPAGLLPSDGLSLWRLFRPVPAMARSMAVARSCNQLRDAVGEQRPFVLYADLAAVEWSLLGATEAADRWRACADGARVKLVGRVERAAEVVARGMLARARGREAEADACLAEVRRLAPNDQPMQDYAAVSLAGAPPTDPWFCCRELRERAAAEPDPARAAELYRQAAVQAFAPAAGVGDHPDDLRDFAAATDDLLLAYRRAVRAAGGDMQQATRELLTPVYARWRVGAGPPADLQPPAALDPTADRASGRLGVRLALMQLIVGVLLLAAAAAWGRPVPMPLRLGVAAGLAAVLWTLVPLAVAGVVRLLPAGHPGRQSAGRAVLGAAAAGFALAAGQFALTADIAVGP